MSQPRQQMDTTPRHRRTWARSVVTAAVIVAVVTGLSAVVNPLLGRTMHWDIVSVLMPALFVALTAALRWHWV